MGYIKKYRGQQREPGDMALHAVLRAFRFPVPDSGTLSPCFSLETADARVHLGNFDDFTRSSPMIIP